MKPAGLLLALAFAAFPASAQDAARGRQLYETHCGGCHYERVHERARERSLVKSLAELRVEVVRRAQQTRQRFTIEDLDDLAEYLNRSHYKFEK
ncbi:MAG: hypothetical protein HYX46_02790 [Betaproteobacteria bacterium]|nr:hypothetical protein [Betaproteobacteria bacterium]